MSIATKGTLLKCVGKLGDPRRVIGQAIEPECVPATNITDEPTHYPINQPADVAFRDRALEYAVIATRELEGSHSNPAGPRASNDERENAAKLSGLFNAEDEKAVVARGKAAQPGSRPAEAQKRILMRVGGEQLIPFSTQPLQSPEITDDLEPRRHDAGQADAFGSPLSCASRSMMRCSVNLRAIQDAIRSATSSLKCTGSPSAYHSLLSRPVSCNGKYGTLSAAVSWRVTSS